MLEGIPRLSVLVITYKQENIIGRTLDSLLDQKDYIYEICVSDDCSPDNTWGVLQDYQKRYPDIIKLHRNDPNVGIFENTEQSWTMPTGDIINQIAGDDITPDGWYKAVVEYIIDNKIDYKNELFCIYGDYEVIYPNGDSKVCFNSAIKKYPKEALRLALRNLINGRGCCFGINVLRKFEKVSQGRSHIAEFLQDGMLQLYSENNYYIPKLGNVYYAYIGVSSRMSEETLKERQQILPYAIKYIENKGVKVNQNDVNYTKYLQYLSDFRFHHTINSFLKTIWFLLLSFDIKLSFAGSGTRSLLFAVLRRVPHKKPINFK